MHIHHHPITLLSLLSLFTTLTSAACTLSHLHSLTAALHTAQTTGLNSNTTLLTPTTHLTQNRRPVTLSSSILSTPLPIAHARSQHDLPQCATFSEFIVLNASAPYVIATQMRIDNTTGQLARLDAIVTTTGDWLFNATGTYYWASREHWGPLTQAQRTSRNVIKAAADAYCDLFADKSVVVPWGSPCARLEGGAYTGKGAASDRCDVGVPSGVALVNRQYVIDEDYGTVDVMMDFGGTVGGGGL
ncbi:predicted protein [Plenodomus lingam JN3]|uniref:DUF8021 domain-containing protein n=1 Tax=Leptosphaeria maculans (strain JN3 / isolate v23.1.3 / race Av1-4-5-6-7-8) TaxID=985895 RepID=E4ZGK4_LEPMJ|nr:predicted protein [Plenodomus lingam JN3]CBX90424.1 predicted protein [Plenodomus lingam JN3]